MANDENVENDAATEQEAEAGQEQGGTGKAKLIVLAALIAILIVAGYFAAPYFMDTESSAAEDGGEKAIAESSSNKPASNKRASNKPALFVSLHPPLVVNFKDAYDDTHFMQFTLEVMAREQSVIDQVKNHAAVIRNSLILMYGNTNYEFVVKREGKEQLLADALKEIQTIIERETGEVGIEAVFFTTLIIQ